MPGANNFLQWNPSIINEESDAAWSSDSQRINGAPSGAIFPSPTANKLFHQVSWFTAAFAQMMANKSYNCVDSNFSNLVTALTNVITNYDVPGHLVQFSNYTMNAVSNKGHIVFPNGFIIQWGRLAVQSGSTATVAYDIAFPTNAFVVLPVSGPGITYQVTVTNITLTNFTIQTPGSTISCFYGALGN